MRSYFSEPILAVIYHNFSWLQELLPSFCSLCSCKVAVCLCKNPEFNFNSSTLVASFSNTSKKYSLPKQNDKEISRRGVKKVGKLVG